MNIGYKKHRVLSRNPKFPADISAISAYCWNEDAL
jgi:hypothetical protein